MSIKVIVESAVENNRMGKSAGEEITTFQFNTEYTVYSLYSFYFNELSKGTA